MHRLPLSQRRGENDYQPEKNEGGCSTTSSVTGSSVYSTRDRETRPVDCAVQANDAQEVAYTTCLRLGRVGDQEKKPPNACALKQKTLQPPLRCSGRA